MSMFKLLTPLRNILFVDNGAMGALSCVFMAIFNGFILLAAKCSS